VLVAEIQRPGGPQNSWRPGPRSRWVWEPTPPDFWAPADLRTVGVCRCSKHYTWCPTLRRDTRCS